MTPNQTPPTYVPRCFAREKTFQNGGSLLSVSFHAESLSQFIREHTDAKGYLNLTIRKRREIGKHDETHTVTLDTWQPKQGFDTMRQAVQQADQQPPLPSNPTQEDVPF